MHMHFQGEDKDTKEVVTGAGFFGFLYVEKELSVDPHSFYTFSLSNCEVLDSQYLTLRKAM